MLDNSGSVAQYLQEINQFVLGLIAQFELSDSATRVGVVEFSQYADVVSGLTASETLLVQSLSQRTATSGLTSISNGLAMAQELFAASPRDVAKALCAACFVLRAACCVQLTAFAPTDHWLLLAARC